MNPAAGLKTRQQKHIHYKYHNYLNYINIAQILNQNN
jgi:hypothetical protein